MHPYASGFLNGTMQRIDQDCVGIIASAGVEHSKLALGRWLILRISCLSAGKMQSWQIVLQSLCMYPTRWYHCICYYACLPFSASDVFNASGMLHIHG